MILHVRMRRLRHDQQQIGLRRHLQRGPERRHQPVRQVTDETHRVRQQRRPLRRQVDQPRLRVESRKEPVIHVRIRVRKCIQQRGLARVCVPHQRHHRPRPPHPRALAPRRDRIDLALEFADPLPHRLVAQLQRALAGTLHADPALEPALLLRNRQPRNQILQLRQLHLDLRLRRLRPTRKDLKNQLGPVDDLDPQRQIQIVHLQRRQIVVEDHHIRARFAAGQLHIRQLAFADQQPRRRLRPTLHDAPDHLRPRRIRQPLQLRQRVRRLRPVAPPQHDLHQQRPLRHHTR